VAFALGQDVVLDPQRAELQVGGEPVVVQSRVLSLIIYLVEQRDRVVSKDDLKATVWEGVEVSDSAIQRAVSLARKALGPVGDALATYPRRGYRFKGEVTQDEDAHFRPSFTRSGDAHIAYMTHGEGPVDYVVIHGWAFPMSAVFSEPSFLRFWTELARLGRAISFDKRGTGMSDRVKQMPSLETRVADLQAVLDDVGSERAVIIGVSEGAPLAIALAAASPERAQGLLLSGGFARMKVGPGYPWGWKNAAIERLRGYIRRDWGRGATVLAAMASVADRPETQAWTGSVELNGASPGAALDLLEMNLSIDVRSRLEAVRCRTIVAYTPEDPVIDPGCSRHLVESIPNAEAWELEGKDHLPMVNDTGRRMLLRAAASLGET
jgi:DNA-binding winged helix-turn-helix (wHTH) protein